MPCNQGEQITLSFAREPVIEIAHSPLTFVTPQGEVVRGAVVVEQPTAAADGGWVCRVNVDGLTPTLGPIAGEDALQALTLGLTLVSRQLRAFVAAGGEIRDDEGSEWPLDAYFPRG